MLKFIQFWQTTVYHFFISKSNRTQWNKAKKYTSFVSSTRMAKINLTQAVGIPFFLREKVTKAYTSFSGKNTLHVLSPNSCLSPHNIVPKSWFKEPSMPASGPYKIPSIVQKVRIHHYERRWCFNQQSFLYNCDFDEYISENVLTMQMNVWKK